MKRTVLKVGALGAWVVVLAACAVRPDLPGSSSPGSGSSTPPAHRTEPTAGPLDPSALREQLRSAAASPKPTSGVFPTPTVSGVDPALAPHIAAATADLASRLGVATDSIEVAAAGVVTWPNTALGCPKPGMAYADQVVDGSLIILRAGGREYRYHAGGKTNPFLCQD